MFLVVHKKNVKVAWESLSDKGFLVGSLPAVVLIAVYRHLVPIISCRQEKKNVSCDTSDGDVADGMLVPLARTYVRRENEERLLVWLAV